MSSAVRWALILLSTVAVGCWTDPGDGPSKTATFSATNWELTYPETGHPIKSVTGNPEVLARETEMETLVNDHRVSIGLDALVEREDIRDVSRAQSEHMIVHGFFAHRNPEGDDPWDRATRAGIVWSAYGENLAGGYPTATQAFDDLLKSPGHKANMEDPQWTGQGHGYAYAPGTEFLYYWTQNFIRP